MGGQRFAHGPGQRDVRTDAPRARRDAEHRARRRRPRGETRSETASDATTAPWPRLCGGSRRKRDHAVDMFAVHRRVWVVCHPDNKRGVKAGELVVDFLGEMYPPWAWQAKQDAIKTVQRIRGMRESGPPEFYNMQLERPAGDAEGFSILFVDAMHHNNYAARLSHSCDPNVEVSLKAIDGKYCINFYAKRDVKAGEELCYNYHSCTDSMKEVEAAFCLCGARGCRASYLAFVGEQGNSHVLKRCHRRVERQAALLAAGDAAAGSIPTPDAVAAMEEVGLKLGRGLLRDVPTWLTHYVAHCALYMKREVAKLPRHILDDHRKTVEKELAKSKGGWKPPPFGLGDAEIEAMAVREQAAVDGDMPLQGGCTCSAGGPSGYPCVRAAAHASADGAGSRREDVRTQGLDGPRAAAGHEAARQVGEGRRRPFGGSSPRGV